MFWLAIKTLLHEKGRLFITLMGITFATILVIAQMGMYLGMMGNATAIIRHIDADIWITSKNIQNFDFANPFPENRIYRVKSMPDVEWAEKLLISFGFLKLANGGREQVQIIGFNPDTGIGAPWTMIEGSPYDVMGGRYMILDKTSEQRLGKLSVGTTYEITLERPHSFKLVGLSQGIKSFTTMPMIFMSYNELWGLFSWFSGERQTIFIVAKVKDKEKIGAVVASLRDTLKDNDVFTKKEFITKSVMYWTIQTGMGMSFFLTALLGLAVGGAIVGQTIYANTMEHIREFGTLKAIGARNIDIYKVIFSQAGISAVVGYLIGIIFILAVRGGMEKGGVSIYLSLPLSFLLFIVIFLTCILSAWFSVRKVKKLDPVMVFRA
ncbi:MAG: ABC transporter permease [Nitrospirae bacterium]|nr:ABC transporter permease [Nitrospirota bacterium]